MKKGLVHAVAAIFFVLGLGSVSQAQTMTATPSALYFPATVPTTTSAPMSTVVTGNYLSPASGTITVTAPSDFDAYDGSSWVSSFTISYSGGSFTRTIPVEFFPTAVTSYSGNLTVSGGGTSVTVPLNGTGATSCSGTPSAGTASSSVSVATSSTAIVLTDAGYSGSSGIVFQWQSSPTSSTWTDISGATNRTRSFTGISANTYYRCVVTCTLSSASASTAAILVTYTAPCSGTPSGGSATASSTYCASCRDTLRVVSGTTGPDITYQWMQSPDGSASWTSIVGASTTPYIFYPNGDFFYKCLVICTASGLSAYSSNVHVVYPYHFTTYSATDSASTLCNGPIFYTRLNGNSSLLSVITQYGDGQRDTIAAVGGPNATTTTHHSYAHSGTYTIKQTILFNGGLQDSISYSYDYTHCRSFPISFYMDVDTNCRYGSSDIVPTSLAFSVKVDSNGTPVDTVYSTSGFYYPANGPTGTVYSFTVISSSSSVHITCPSSMTIYDTVFTSITNYPRKYFGYNCSSSTAFDLGTRFSVIGTGRHAQKGNIYPFNNYCPPTNGQVTLYHSPRLGSHTATPTPTATTATSITWNVSSLSNVNTPPHFYYWLETSSGYLTPGDTVHSMVVITPGTGDADTTNNIVIRNDTSRSSYDPNFIESNPSGHIASGTTLRYTVGFENDGNDTAQNIYVLDTLSDYLEQSTLKPVFASHEMYIEKQKVGGLTIVKFDFPHIKLLDSTHHGLCEGTFQYDINVKNGLPDCTYIPARVGIYFDDNPVVMTNTHTNVIGCWPSVVGSLQSAVCSPLVYPNPASDVLNVETTAGAFQNYSVTNSMGSVVMNGSADGAHTKLNIKNLPAGIYCIRLMGEQGVEVRKFVKE